MRIAEPDGVVLPLVLVGLAAVGLLALAGHDAARFGLSAARSQAAAAAALHAADSGLDLFLAGADPVDGPIAVDAPPAGAVVTVRQIVRLADSSRIVAVSSEGRARRGPAHEVTRRLCLLARIDTIGARNRVPGSWRERL